MTRLPAVPAVIPAHKRPVEMRRAIKAVQESYEGSIETMVFDRAPADPTLAADGERPEGWDLLLQNSINAPIGHLDRPQFRGLRGRSSFLSRGLGTRVASSKWMLANHPDIERDKKAASRLTGQISFTHGCAAVRIQVILWAGKMLRHNPLQWRGWLSVAVAGYPPLGEKALGFLNRYGRGV